MKIWEESKHWFTRQCADKSLRPTLMPMPTPMGSAPRTMRPLLRGGGGGHMYPSPELGVIQYPVILYGDSEGPDQMHGCAG